MQDSVTLIIKSTPRFEDLDYVPTLKEAKLASSRPFYEGVYSKGGKKKGKRR
jgi:hypothetical protein